MHRNSGDFYSQLAYWYDEIFPVSVQQIDFVHNRISSFTEADPKRLLDVGCGTGALAVTLSIMGVKVTGIDLNRDMIEQARFKADELGTTPEFYVMDMHKLTNNLAGKSFEVISCLGNTLVHMNSLEEVRDALIQFDKLLTPSGMMILQVLNYDKVLKEGITVLPTIEQEGILFERSYRWKAGDPTITFSTRLTTPDTLKPIEQETELFPLRQHQLQSLLEELDYPKQSWYGSYAEEPADESLLPLIVCASRK